MDDLDEMIRQARQLARDSQWTPKARQLNRRIIDLDPDNVDALTRGAKCAELEGDLEEALEAYERALQLEPGNKVAENGRERIRQQLGPLELAKRHNFRKRTNSYESAMAVAMDAKDCRDIDTEIAALMRALRFSRTAKALTMLGGAFRRRGRLDDAEEVYGEALDKCDNHASRVGLAAVFRDRGYLDKQWLWRAKQILEEVLDEDSKDKYAWMGLAGVYSDLDMPEKACECTEQALGLGWRPGDEK